MGVKYKSKLAVREVVLGIIFMACIAVAYYRMYYRKKNMAVEGKEKEISTLVQEDKLNSDILKKLKTQAEIAKKRKSFKEEEIKVVDNKKQLSEVLEMFSRPPQNVTIKNIKATSVIKIDDVKKHTLRIDIDSDFESITSYIESLESFTPYLNISYLEVNKDGAYMNSCTAVLEIQLFVQEDMVI